MWNNYNVTTIGLLFSHVFRLRTDKRAERGR